ncbi:MAG: site-2 protease family protein, partial [Oscillospiraceae bacterium]|nr:site-2 protease family protein [Oscillospiraceae bacterium]
IGLAIFNLIPIPPLDGSKIISYFTSYKVDRWIEKNYMIINIVFLFVIASRILSVPLGLVRNIIIKFLWFITGFIPELMGV